jgi:hypothetical protein
VVPQDGQQKITEQGSTGNPLHDWRKHRVLLFVLLPSPALTPGSLGHSR